MTGKIIKAISGFYYVECGGTVYECKAKGSFKHQGTELFVGDDVTFSLSEKGYHFIEEVLPRKTHLDRPPIANIDKLFIVSSYSCPSVSTYIIDRLTAAAVMRNIEPVIVFNKSDEGDFTGFSEIYGQTPFKTYVISAKNNVGIAEIRKEVADCSSAFIGNSGVGKSSIINAIFPKLDLKTGEVSQKLGRGKHTTREVVLIHHEYGGYIADTPGFSSLEFGKDVLDVKERLPELFPEFSEFIGNCKFVSCNHTKEDGCAIIKAVNEGIIPKSRFESYKTLFEELKEYKPWNSKTK